MTALPHPVVVIALDGEDTAIDQYPNRAIAAEVANLDPGESLEGYFADRYDWSLLSRMRSDPELMRRYSPPIRVPVYPSQYGGGFDGGSFGSAV